MTATAPPLLLSTEELEALDAAVEGALSSADPSALPVIGVGEISTVLAWPMPAPRVAAKRLPVMSSAAQLARYDCTVRDYVARLEASGVRVVSTVLASPPGTPFRTFLLQPLASRLLSTVLAGSPAGDPLVRTSLAAIVSHVARTVDEDVGLDAQVSNWALDEKDDLAYLDVSTPFLRDATSVDRLDLSWLCSVYPAALRPAIRRWVAPSVVAAYHDPRLVLVDVGANLFREGLHRHAEALIEVAGTYGFELDAREFERYIRANLRTWKVLRALRRLDARWQRHVRRRPYPFLLPEVGP